MPKLLEGRLLTKDESVMRLPLDLDPGGEVLEEDLLERGGERVREGERGR